MKICILCSSFNRANITIIGLSSLIHALRKVPQLSFSVFLLDDASTDGTAELVKQTLPEVHIVKGTGNLFWNRGMVAAYEASKTNEFGTWDAYLLFNDDTVVDTEGVLNFFKQYIYENLHRSTVCVGRLIDPDTRSLTYGAYRRPLRCQPLHLLPVDSIKLVESCDTFNGNFVLIPATAFDEIGGLCSEYWHTYGDIDLGYALSRRGSRIVLIHKFIGTARRNPPADMSTWKKRYKNFFEPPYTIRQIYVFYRRNGCTNNWWLYATGAVLKKIFRIAVGN